MKPWWLQELLKSTVSRALPSSMLVLVTIPALQLLCGQPHRESSPIQTTMPSHLLTLEGPYGTTAHHSCMGAGGCRDNVTYEPCFRKERGVAWWRAESLPGFLSPYGYRWATQHQPWADHHLACGSQLSSHLSSCFGSLLGHGYLPGHGACQAAAHRGTPSNLVLLVSIYRDAQVSPPDPDIRLDTTTDLFLQSPSPTLSPSPVIFTSSVFFHSEQCTILTQEHLLEIHEQ